MYKYLKLMNNAINQKSEALEQKIDSAPLDHQTRLKALKQSSAKILWAFLTMYQVSKSN